MSSTAIFLNPVWFQTNRQKILETSGLRAEIFRYPSGVCAVQIENMLGRLVLLPYQGQQIWSAWMCGRELTMRSMFTQPYPTRDFLATFGGFFVHCGGAARAVPGQEAIRPLHGELPNAPYESAELILGEDEYGTYLGLTGFYQHTVSFYHNFSVRPEVRLYAGSSMFQVGLMVENLKHTQMDFTYLAHINFRPIDGGRLVYSAPCDPQHMRIRTALPANLVASSGYADFVEDLAAHPEKHLVIQAGQSYDPEVVLHVDYHSGADGWARQMQIHPDGSADLVRHHPRELGRGVRWICRTPDQDAIGFEAATGDSQNGVLSLEAGEVFSCKIWAGYVNPEAARLEEELASNSL